MARSKRSRRSKTAHAEGNEPGRALSPTPISPSSRSPLLPPQGEIFALVVVHAVLVALVLHRHLDFLFNDAAHRLGPGTDFWVYYGAAKHWLADGNVFAETTAFGYRYHPGFAQGIGVLLGWMPRDTAYAVWVAINELALLAVAITWYRELPSRRSRFVGGILLLTSAPQLLELYMGQSTLLCACLLFFALRGSRNRPWLAAATFGLALVVKPFALVAAPLLLFRRCWIVLFVGGAVAITTALLYFVFDQQGFEIFRQLNFHPLPKIGWVIHAGNQGLHNLLATTFARLAELPTKQVANYDQFPSYARSILTVLPVVATGLSVWVAYRLRRHGSLAMFALASAFLLGYKDVWEHSYAIVLPFVAGVWHSNRLEGWLPRVGLIGLTLPSLFFIYDATYLVGTADPEHVWSAGTAIFHHASRVISLLLVFVPIVIAAVREPARGADEPEPYL